ncbi:AMP-binding protein [Arvimicrobium flavum]|uniref:AMP-binding protein n=1 Tax=Arvimicrobium flavum TaxID=3393320 RepID=UPI00237A11C8|nr:AMP-binding protein [Mesorhizobium shangrilense]
MSTIVFGENRLDGGELPERGRKAAAVLRSYGIDRSDAVALLLRNGLTFVEASAALQHLGCYVLPINWHAAHAEIAHVLRDAGVKALIAHDDLLTHEVRERLPGIPIFVVDRQSDTGSGGRDPDWTAPAGTIDWRALVVAQVPIETVPAVAAESLFYTSGTSGLPKGVRRAVPNPDQVPAIARMRHAITRIGKASRVLLTAPMYHTAPNMYATRAVREAELLVLPARFDPHEFLALIEKHRITDLYAVSTIFTRLLALPQQHRAQYDLSSLESVLHAGSPCPVSVKRAMIAWLGPKLIEYYGSTEHGPLTFVTAPEWMERPGTVGRAIDGVTLAIFDDEGNAVPAGVAGEVYGANANYPDFTYNNDAAARAVLDRQGLIATGDVGYFDADGYLFLCDRKRDMVISGGVNIYPVEIENAAMGYSGIADCAVFGVPDAEFGEALALLAEAHPGSDLQESDLRAHLAKHLPRFKQPKIVEIRGSLPRDDSGKIRKRVLREPYWAGYTNRI